MKPVTADLQKRRKQLPHWEQGGSTYFITFRSARGYLPDIMRGIKGTSARFINKTLGTSGPVWQEESFDRIVRDQQEYDEKLQYMWNNPVKAGLVEVSEEYSYFVYVPE